MSEFLIATSISCVESNQLRTHSPMNTSHISVHNGT